MMEKKGLLDAFLDDEKLLPNQEANGQNSGDYRPQVEALRNVLEKIVLSSAQEESSGFDPLRAEGSWPKQKVEDYAPRDIEAEFLREMFKRLFPDNPKLRAEFQRDFTKMPSVPEPIKISMSNSANRFVPPPPQPGPSQKQRMLDLLGLQEPRLPNIGDSLEPWQRDLINGKLTMERYLKRMAMKRHLEKRK